MCKCLGDIVKPSINYSYLKQNKQTKNQNYGTSLVVQWLRVHASNAGAAVRSLVGEPRSHTPCGAAKTKTKKNLLTQFHSSPFLKGGLLVADLGITPKQP